MPDPVIMASSFSNLKSDNQSNHNSNNSNDWDYFIHHPLPLLVTTILFVLASVTLRRSLTCSRGQLQQFWRRRQLQHRKQQNQGHGSLNAASDPNHRIWGWVSVLVMALVSYGWVHTLVLPPTASLPRDVGWWVGFLVVVGNAVDGLLNHDNDDGSMHKRRDDDIMALKKDLREAWIQKEATSNHNDDDDDSSESYYDMETMTTATATTDIHNSHSTNLKQRR